MIPALALKSLRNRGFTAVLTVLSIALSVTLLLGVERLRSESRESFAATVSGTDLVVGARGSPVHLLLYSVFRIGNATNNLRWDSFAAITAHPQATWAIPISLGDSHRGFRVIGTSADYFMHYRFGDGRRLTLAQGRPFTETGDAVLGADVADKLGYRIGDAIVVAHGAGDVAFSLHEEQPFRVAGILERTGTPVDRGVHVGLQALDSLHAGTVGGDVHDPMAAALRRHDRDEHSDGMSSQRTISAFLLGLKSRSAALAMQRTINDYAGEPLTAIMPGVTLLEVWEIVGTVERTLFAVSALVVVVGFSSMLVALMTSLGERRREMAILRSVGARPSHVFTLILGEAALLTLLGIGAGIGALYAGLIAGRGWLASHYGMYIGTGWPSGHESALIALVAAAGILIGLIPAYRIYRYSLSDGLTIRL